MQRVRGAIPFDRVRRLEGDSLGEGIELDHRRRPEPPHGDGLGQHDVIGRAAQHRDPRSTNGQPSIWKAGMSSGALASW